MPFVQTIHALTWVVLMHREVLKKVLRVLYGLQLVSLILAM
jgi:hypothetical protein